MARTESAKAATRARQKSEGLVAQDFFADGERDRSHSRQARSTRDIGA
jgi:hypothetical protein